METGAPEHMIRMGKQECGSKLRVDKRRQRCMSFDVGDEQGETLT
jgi:hypothetical protein